MFPRRGSGSCKLPFPSCLGYTADKDELVEAYSGNMAREPVVLNVYDMVSVQLFHLCCQSDLALQFAVLDERIHDKHRPRCVPLRSRNLRNRSVTYLFICCVDVQCILLLQNSPTVVILSLSQESLKSDPGTRTNSGNNLDSGV